MSTAEEKKSRIAELRREIEQLETEVPIPQSDDWRRQGEHYWSYYATSGLLLGMIASASSLLLNVIAAPIFGKEPLRIIKVYLTFPLGEQALAEDFDNGLILAIGCCLYLGTGMVLGMVLHTAMSLFVPKASLVGRLAFATVAGLVIWAFNFYAVLSWLQPLLFGGNWIASGEHLPAWVGAVTHLVFAWTMALLYPWGTFDLSRRTISQES